MTKHTLYMAHVTEHEFEAGWGASTRPDGTVFCSSRELLIKVFNGRRLDMQESDSSCYSLYETISKPVLVEVDANCIQFYNYKTRSNDSEVLWLRGESLKEFMKGVTK